MKFTGIRKSDRTIGYIIKGVFYMYVLGFHINLPQTYIQELNSKQRALNRDEQAKAAGMLMYSGILAVVIGVATFFLSEYLLDIL